MPGFPDKFAPFYKAPPGTAVSSTWAKLTGTFVRPLRRITERDRNREVAWDHPRDGRNGRNGGSAPTGWGATPAPTVFDRAVHYFYDRMRRSDTAARQGG
jgi:hydrogenase small subunit